MHANRDVLKTLVVGTILVTLMLPACAEEKKPNVLIVLADDMLWRDCEPYGNAEVKTPNMARLAKEGMRFDRMFTATAMCAPTRQQLYTGMFPVRNGAYPNHSGVYSGVKSMVHHLKALGYRVGLSGKTHFKPRESFPFDMVGKNISQFVNRDKNQPYCLVVCSNEPHAPWSKGDASVYPPAKLTIPPYLVDTPETREALSAYYAEITELDKQLGACMKIVDESGSKEDTALIFTSEQGSQIVFGGKWTCYDTGLKTSFIVRWPSKVKAGSSNEAMCQYCDVVPTLVEMAGGDPAKIDTGRPDTKGYTGFDGKSFYNVLLGKADTHRDYVFGVHTTRGIINGTDYPIRSVRSKTHKLILNLNHENTFTNAVTGGGHGGGKAWKSWIAAGGEAAKRGAYYQKRPAEELFDLTKDPWELKNLADDPACAEIKKALREKLDAFMAQQGDKGMETEQQAGSRKGGGKKKGKGK